MEKTRRQFTPQQKVAILREHLVEHVPVSDLCDKHKLHPRCFTSGSNQSAFKTAAFKLSILVRLNDSLAFGGKRR